MRKKVSALKILVISVLLIVVPWCSGSLFASELAHTTATLSEPRYWISATTVDNKAIFAGGSGNSDVVDIYDANTGQWSTATLSQGRMKPVAVTAGNKALFAGGKRSSPFSVSDTVDIYDASTGLWFATTLSVGRYNHTGTSVANKAMFAGGTPDGSYHWVDLVEIYDAGTGQWSTVYRPYPMWGCATTVNDKAMFAGGWYGRAYASVEIYDASLGEPNDPNAWSRTGLSQARCKLAATTVGNKAMFAGGYWYQGDANYPVSDVVDIYDANLGEPNDPNAWSTATLSQARSHLVATTVGNKAIFAGGTSHINNYVTSNVVDIYDADIGEPNDPNAWSTTTLSQARVHLAATTVANKAMFAGGNIQTNGTTWEPSDMVDIFILCEYELAGDVNHDCKVDFFDLAMMAANWLVDCGITPDEPACIPE